MSLETELQRRLEAAATAFEPDPAVLVAAERRAGRQRTVQRTVRVLAAAAAVIVAGVIAVLVTTDDSPRNPIVDSPPLEREEGEAPEPELPPIEDDAAPETDDGEADQDAEGPDEEGTQNPDVDPAGAWSELPPGPLTPRSGAAATWTTDRVFIWGGRLETGLPATVAADGAFFDPATDEWQQISDAPSGLADGHAVWTGDEVLVFGGGAEQALTPSHQDTLLAYDPASDSWSTEDAPPLEPRAHASVSWTGDELVVWGGATFIEPQEGGPIQVRMHADGAAFDPQTRTWRTLADTPIAPRGQHGAVWNGRRLVIFGGGAADQIEGEFTWLEQPADAAAYDPTSDSWTTIVAPDTGPVIDAEWTGEAIVYWTGHVDPQDPGNWLEPGGVWDTSTGQVTPMAAPPFDGRRDEAPVLWAEGPRRLLTWGGSVGEGGNHLWHTGASYDPEEDTWSVMADGPLGARDGHVAVWTGSQLVVWGGATDGFERADEGNWDPEYELRDDGAVWQLEPPEP